MLPCLAPLGEAIGVDLPLEALAAARARGYRAVVAGDALRLPFRDGGFDAVCLFDTLEHCDDDAAVLAECARCLRRGGTLLVTGPAYPFLYAQNDRVAHHRRRYTLRTLRVLLTRAGLRVVRGTYVNSLLFPAILPAVLLLKAKERIFRTDGKTTNLSYRLPSPLNEALAAIFSAEGRLVTRVSFPAGHSLALLARKDPRSPV